MAEEQPRRYRKRPLEIEALRFDGDNQDDILNWADGQPEPPAMWLSQRIDGLPQIIIRTLEGQMAASPGDWVIRGVEGEFYPCKDSVFQVTYEAIS